MKLIELIKLLEGFPSDLKVRVLKGGEESPTIRITISENRVLIEGVNESD